MSTLEAATKKFATDAKGAEADLVAYVAKNPKDAQGHVALGTTRLKLGDYERAAESFKQATVVDPANTGAQTLLAVTYQQANRTADALAAWQQVARAEPKSRDALEHVSALAEATGNTELALQARRELAQLSPGSPEVVADLAVYLSRAGLHAEAVRTFERATVLEPGFLEKHPVENAAYQQSRAARGAR